MPTQDIVMPTQCKHSLYIRSVGQIYPRGLSTHENPTTPQCIYSSTYKLINLQAHQLQTYKFVNSKLTSSSTHKFKNTRTCKLINSSTQNPSTQNLKSLSFILQYRSNFHSVLAKLQVKKQAKSHYLQLLMPVVLSVFRLRTCILHHFTFLVWPKARNLSRPKTHFQTPKSHFLTTILPFLAMCFMVL